MWQRINPQTGFKKREELEIPHRDYGTIFRAYNGGITGGLATSDGYSAVVPLTW
jgi:hypothetical protein